MILIYIFIYCFLYTEIESRTTQFLWLTPHTTKPDANQCPLLYIIYVYRQRIKNTVDSGRFLVVLNKESTILLITEDTGGTDVKLDQTSCAWF
jgi:hypothetical protein